MLHVSSYWQMIIKGLVIVTAVYVDSLKKKKARMIRSPSASDEKKVSTSRKWFIIV